MNKININKEGINWFLNEIENNDLGEFLMKGEFVAIVWSFFIFESNVLN